MFFLAKFILLLSAVVETTQQVPGALAAAGMLYLQPLLKMAAQAVATVGCLLAGLLSRPMQS
jgi:hypothetical protein